MKTKHDPRHIARQVALMSLFEWSFHSDESGGIIDHVVEAAEAEPIDRPFVQQLVDGVIDHLDGLDSQIIMAAPEWPRDQIAKTDIAILRLALFELQCSDVPHRVVIDEAVELAKEFGGDTSSKFVNGVLGTLVKDTPKPKPAAKAST